MSSSQVSLCAVDGCRLLSGHSGDHSRTPASAWDFLERIDQNKLNKAGYATPRGGSKGAYQNHVYRNNKVIIPYERLESSDLDIFEDGYVIRLMPDQYFSDPGVPAPEFTSADALVKVGENAFVLYRTHESLKEYPPLDTWRVRRLLVDGKEVQRRSRRAVDEGHYVLRLPTLGQQTAVTKGPPQGIFAPEYAPKEVNYLSQCVLAWLIVHTVGSPYTTTQAQHIKAILTSESIATDSHWEYLGVLRHGLTSCPLCSRLIRYQELHSMLTLDEEQALENAAVQIEGATRSTVVNLFHIDPLKYDRLSHLPDTVAWGHAVCNTKLGQRKCYSLDQIQEHGMKVGLVLEEGIETFGWLSADWEMIRSPGGSVWARLCGDVAEGPPPGLAGPGQEIEERV